MLDMSAAVVGVDGAGAVGAGAQHTYRCVRDECVCEGEGDEDGW